MKIQVIENNQITEIELTKTFEDYCKYVIAAHGMKYDDFVPYYQKLSVSEGLSEDSYLTNDEECYMDALNGSKNVKCEQDYIYNYDNGKILNISSRKQKDKIFKKFKGGIKQ